ncbi:CBN-SRXA-9 protein [Caenorhabditis brenneri]|uniref:CBN-SRXA-9 protein n=1 Tax=Caenorhabditis brenneri TaxID=135651 RepID=G0MAQ4_CAEBE|nr:CBN-SRXA-9 protein [Caenorhabditis brenneri]
MESVVSTTIASLVSPPGSSLLKKFLYALSVIFPFTFLVFDSLLLLAVIRNRRDSSLPLAYIAVMCMTGMISKFAMTLNSFLYVVLPLSTYIDFLNTFGRIITLTGTFAYLNALYISVLMTINRIVVIIRPFKTDWFSQRRVFLYCGVIFGFVLGSLLVPFYSVCFIVFRLDLLAFVSGCAPNRHPITQFQNTNSIYFPLSSMFGNTGLIVHLRMARNGIYNKIQSWFRPSTVVVPAFNSVANKSLSKIQARRDFIMMRQTISVAAYLSIYELGALLIRTFPEAYMNLPQDVRDGIFYLRYESVAIMNFFIYYVETGSTRRMLKRFLGIRERNNSSADNQTMATVAVRGTRGASARSPMN